MNMYYKCKDTGAIYNNAQLAEQFQKVPEECLVAYKASFDKVIPSPKGWIAANSHIEIDLGYSSTRKTPTEGE